MNTQTIQSTDALQRDDDYFFQQPADRNAKEKSRRERGFPCCCLSWERDTWRGIGTIFSGMMIQASLGIASIWGNIVIYVTSKLRAQDPQLSLQFTIIVFPAILAVGSIAMQAGNKLMDRMNPRLQVCLGGIIWVSAVFCAQFPESFTGFFLVYSVMGGIGFGIIYFVPLLCAWSYFPTKRNLVAGVILMCFSLNAILCSQITTTIVNPYNDKPDITVSLGKNTESYFGTDSYQVEMLPEMFTRLAQIALCFLVLSLPLLNKKEDDYSRKSAVQILDEAIRQNEIQQNAQFYDEQDSVEPKLTYQNSDPANTPQNHEKLNSPRDDSPLKSERKMGHSSILPRVNSLHSNQSMSSYRARNSFRMRKSVQSMGSSVKSATVSEEGVLLQSDLSDLRFSDSYRDRKFWHIWTMIIFSMMFAFFMKVAFKSYGSTIYSDDEYLTNTAKIGFLTAAVSRFGWAALQEVLGFKPVYMILLFMQLFLSFSMTSIAHNPTLYTIWVCLTWSCEGGQQSIFPPLAGQVYGTELGVRVNALFFTGFGFSAVMGVVFNNTVVPYLGWDAMFIILGCFTGISLLMLFFFKPVQLTFIPFDDEREMYDTKKVKPHKAKKRKSSRSKKKDKVEDDADDASSNASLNTNQQDMLRKPLLFVNDR